MATLTERLALVIQGDASSAIRAFNLTGDAAKGAQARITGGQDAIKSAFASFAQSPVAIAAASAVAYRTLFQLATAASNLNEQVSNTKVTFGSASSQVLDFAKSAVSGFGLSQRAALEASNSFAALFKTAGLGPDLTAQFSTTLAKLGADLASFKNLNQEDVLGKLRSGLTGQVRPLRDLGILLDDATVQAKAMQLGLSDANGAVDDGAKVIARYALILQQTKDAQGDYSRTSNQMANSQRTLSAEFENFQATLGQAVTPALTELMATMSRFVEVADGALSAVGGLGKATGFLADIAIKATPGLNVLSLIGDTFGKHRDASKEAAAAQSDYTKALAQATGVARSFQQATEDAAKDTKDLTSTVVGLVRAREAQAAASQAIDRARRQEADAQRELNNLLVKGAVDATAVAAAQRGLRDATRSVASAVQAQADAQAALDKIRQGANALDVRSAQLDLLDARRNQERSALGIAKAQDQLNRLVVIGVLANGQQASTALDVASANLDVADSKEEVERADIAAQRAQERLTELQNQGKEGSKDLKDAQQKLADATQAVADAQEHQQDSQSELNKALAGDPDFQEKIRDARQKVADATGNIANATTAARDAAIAAAGAQDDYNSKLGVSAGVLKDVADNFDRIAKANAGLDFSAFQALVPSAAVANPVATLQGVAGAVANPFGGGLSTGAAPIIINVTGNQQPWQTALAVQDTLAAQRRRSGG